jgi:hypothetical protein
MEANNVQCVYFFTSTSIYNIIYIGYILVYNIQNIIGKESKVI